MIISEVFSWFWNHTFYPDKLQLHLSWVLTLNEFFPQYGFPVLFQSKEIISVSTLWLCRRKLSGWPSVQFSFIWGKIKEGAGVWDHPFLDTNKTDLALKCNGFVTWEIRKLIKINNRVQLLRWIIVCWIDNNNETASW